jgi:hypothetical protein
MKTINLCGEANWKCYVAACHAAYAMVPRELRLKLKNDGEAGGTTGNLYDKAFRAMKPDDILHYLAIINKQEKEWCRLWGLTLPFSEPYWFKNAFINWSFMAPDVVNIFASIKTIQEAYIFLKNHTYEELTTALDGYANGEPQTKHKLLMMLMDCLLCSPEHKTRALQGNMSPNFFELERVHLLI